MSSLFWNCFKYGRAILDLLKPLKICQNTAVFLWNSIKLTIVFWNTFISRNVSKFANNYIPMYWFKFVGWTLKGRLTRQSSCPINFLYLEICFHLFLFFVFVHRFIHDSPSWHLCLLNYNGDRFQSFISSSFWTNLSVFKSFAFWHSISAALFYFI